MQLPAGRFPPPEAFRCAWEALQRASLHGRMGNYVRDIVVRLRNFSDDGFLETVRHPAATVEGFSKWVAEGMISNQSDRPPDTVRWHLGLAFGKPRPMSAEGKVRCTGLKDKRGTLFAIIKRLSLAGTPG